MTRGLGDFGTRGLEHDDMLETISVRELTRSEDLHTQGDLMIRYLVLQSLMVVFYNPHQLEDDLSTSGTTPVGGAGPQGLDEGLDFRDSDLMW